MLARSIMLIQHVLHVQKDKKAFCTRPTADECKVPALNVAMTRHISRYFHQVALTHDHMRCGRRGWRTQTGSIPPWSVAFLKQSISVCKLQVDFFIEAGLPKVKDHPHSKKFGRLLKYFPYEAWERRVLITSFLCTPGHIPPQNILTRRVWSGG